MLVVLGRKQVVLSIQFQSASLEAICKLVKQQRLSSALMRKRLCFLGHLERMKDEHVPKKLLVCAPELGKQTAGGQHIRWSDGVTKDLKRCGLKEGWRERAHDCDSWKQDITKKAEELNAEDEKEELHRKDERKRKHTERKLQSEIALHCDWPGCPFYATNRSGLVNHQHRSHGTQQLIPCLYCGREM